MSIEDFFPLTALQHGMLYHAIRGSRQGAYVTQLTWEAVGSFDVDLFEAACRAVIDRHEILRCAFAWEGLEQPAHLLHDRVDLPVARVDWQGLDPEEENRRIDAWLREDRARGFDLTRPPLARVLTATLAPQRHRVFWTVHHLIVDGWSVSRLIADLSHIYGALRRGETPALPPAVGFRRFLLWLRDRDRTAAEAFWRPRLRGFAEPMPLPLAREGQATEHASSPATTTFALSVSETAAIEQLCRARHLTVGALVAGAWGVLLGSMTGREDVLFGWTVAGRPPDLAGAETIVGPIINTVPFRARVSSTDSLGSWLRQLHGSQADVQPFEQTALVDFQRWSDVPAGVPLFRTLLVHESYPRTDMTAFDFGGAQIQGVQVREDPDYPLSVTTVPGRSLELRLSYDATLFDDAAVRRLGQGFTTLLRTAGTVWDQRLRAWTTVTAPDRRRLLDAWNATDIDTTLDLPIHEQIERQAARTPDAPALIWSDGRCTYAELMSRAGRLARLLRARGVGPESKVVVGFEQSIEMVIAVLAIWQAGGAFVPIDPSYPGARIAETIADCKPSVIVTRSAWRDRFTDDVEVLAMDDLRRQDRDESYWPAATNAMDRLAYIIYTSGSTGRPKGVMVSHRGLPNLAAEARRLSGARPGMRILQFTSPTFDVWVWECLMALTSGAALAIAPRDALLPGPDLARTVRDLHVDVLTLTPSSLAALSGAESMPSLKTLMLAGEACTSTRLGTHAVGRRVLNLYGPTEATVITLGTTEFATPVALVGRPLANTHAYVLTRDLELTPIGVPGELCLSGAGLARGYHARPAQTAERFVPHPFLQDCPGARLYRTGDRARYREDGVIEFLGRLDDQVKVRGYRIEPAEVARALERHPQVAEAVVLAAADEPAAGLRLLAFIRSRGDTLADAQELRAWLAKILPAWMIPARIVALPDFPHLPSGKLDRRQLRELASTAPVAARSTSAHRTSLEAHLAQVWKELLGLDEVGVQDNFFDLGGHSLMLVALHDRLPAEHKGRLTPIDLFRYPTIASLAGYLTGLEQDAAPPPAVASSAAADPAPLAPAADRRIAIIGMAGRFPGGDDVNTFWQRLCAGEDLITRFSDVELRAAGVAPTLLQDPRYVRARGVLDGYDQFDASFFNLTPRDAEVMDPQQRVLLECAWQALEDAGCPPASGEARIGIYAGGSPSAYALRVLGKPEVIAGGGEYKAMLANMADSLTTRVAYKLGLTGPAVTVQTACSTSLVAVHLACQALLMRDCDVALAGGASIRVPQRAGYLHQPGGITSEDGCCRAFDAAATGTVDGSGVGLVALKRYQDAVRDGDTVRAIIRGSAINNDGAMKVGYTAPSVDGQAAVIRDALTAAGVSAATVQYVEAHGTGTPMGDPIEVAALTQAFRQDTEAIGYCGLGSVKTNVGHLDAAAGVAGLIKATLSVETGLLAPTLHAVRPNPAMNLPSSPFHIVTRATSWGTADSPRRAGVSSFGIGGTNAHVILEQAPIARSGPSRPWQLLPVSARTPAALSRRIEALAQHARAHEDIDLADVAYTLQRGRVALPHRGAWIGSTASRGGSGLEMIEAARDAEARPTVVWLLPEAVHHDAAHDTLHATESIYRAAFDAADAETSSRTLQALGALWRAWIGPPDAVVAAGAIAGFATDSFDTVKQRLSDTPPSSIVVLTLGTAADAASLIDGRAWWCDGPRVLAALAGDDVVRAMLTALGRLWMSGVPVDWRAFSAAERRRKVPLPGYPFERQRYWIEPAPPPVVQAVSSPPVAANGSGDRLASLWTEVLGTTPASIDDFFDNGGDSVSALQLAARIEQEFGIPFSVRNIFESSVFSGLERVVNEARGAAVPR